MNARSCSRPRGDCCDRRRGRHRAGNVRKFLFFGLQARWSPSGRSIAFQDSEFGGDVFVSDAQGQHVRELTNGLEIFAPTWSSDGSRIVFASFVNGYSFVLYTIKADGTGLRRLTQPSDSHLDNYPAWSPDGSEIAFTRTFAQGFQRVFVMNADGTDLRPVSPRTLDGGGPNWSPDGTKIVFGSYYEYPGPSDIYVVDADGSGLMRLTTTGSAVGGAAWSPDGTKIAYADLQTSIVLMNPDGSGKTVVAQSVGAFDLDWGRAPS